MYLYPKSDQKVEERLETIVPLNWNGKNLFAITMKRFIAAVTIGVSSECLRAVSL
jgi:hypothetical protein